MNLSYWEQKSWFSNLDFTIVGSGIVGLNCALYLKEKYPEAKVLILEKGLLPQGASTKNAGFACFGSLSEIIDDLKSHSEQEVLELVQKRWDGLQLLRKKIGDEALDYQVHGGYELFSDADLFDECISRQTEINKLLKPIFRENVFSFKSNNLGFQKIVNKLSYNTFEGQIDTGSMMEALLQKVSKSGIKILNNISVKSFGDLKDKVVVTANDFEIKTSKLFIATNGFAQQLLNKDVRPARAQVLITKPIENLHLKGTFHLDKGYYYFRNIDHRILFGGGRNLDFSTEETTEFGYTELVQNKLKTLLKTTVLPGKPFEIDSIWSGIMGVGEQKKPIVKQVENNVFCGIRLGGMGVAVGSTVGKELAELL